MNAPQIVMLVMLAVSLTIHACHHGQEYPFRVSFWSKLADVLFILALLIWGGFFNA